MIKKLRRKFVLIMMCIVAAILLAVFIAVLHTTQTNIERNSVMALRQSIFSERFGGGFSRPGDTRDKPDMRTPTILIEIGSGGQVTTLQNRIYFISEDEIPEIARLVQQQQKETGVLSSYNLRFLVMDLPEGGSRIALADTSMEHHIIRNLVLSSLLIGGGALVLFLLLSIFLARWTVRPVQQAWDRQRQFVADASHELKTPLTVILSNADMLAASHEFTDEKEARRMDNIQAEGKRMKRLVEDMLILASADSAETALVFARVDLSDVVTDSILLFEPTVYDSGKQFTYQVQKDIAVLGDAGRLRQVVDALMDNALKYCPKGGQIAVVLQSIGKQAHLTVQSEGEPIPKEELRTVFDRFYRLDKARSGGGFGLGLSIARSIVESQGGEIWAESSPETGNRFYVTLPIIA